MRSPARKGPVDKHVWPRVMFTARTPAFAGTSRAVKKYLLARTPLPESPVTSLGTTRSASGADSARSLVATYSPGSLMRAAIA